MRVLMTLLAVLFAVPVSAQSLCVGDSTPVLVIDPSMAVVATLADYNTESVWTSSELKVTLRGAGPDAAAVQNGTITNPKSAWYSIAGTDCYEIGIVGQFLFGVPPGIDYDLWMRLRNDGNGIAGPWNATGVSFRADNGTTEPPPPEPPPPPPPPPEITGCLYQGTLYPVGGTVLITTTQPRVDTIQQMLTAAGWIIDSIIKEQRNVRTIAAHCG